MTETTSPNLHALKESEEIEFPPAPRDIPQEVKDFVDRGHEYWKLKPHQWRRTPALGTEKDARRIAGLARDYAKTTARTFRTKAHADKTRLVYKVTDAFQPSANGDQADPDPSSAAPSSTGKAKTGGGKS